MPQSLTKLYAHLVFSTKHRRPLLDKEIRPAVHGYMASVLRDLECPWVKVGGVEDHIHILLEMGRKHAPAELVEKVKRESSKFVKTLGDQYRQFYWQRGYSIFSVGPMQRDVVATYIDNQEEHHKRHTYREELLTFLKRYQVSYDDRYLWD